MKSPTPFDNDGSAETSPQASPASNGTGRGGGPTPCVLPTSIASRCAGCGFDPTRLRPIDGVSAIRSLPRRIRNRRLAAAGGAGHTGASLSDHVESLDQHLRSRARLIARAEFGVTDDSSDPLAALTDAVESIPDRDLFYPDGRRHDSWQVVLEFLHDAVHHLRRLDHELHGQRPELTDVDLDAGDFDSVDFGAGDAGGTGRGREV